MRILHVVGLVTDDGRYGGPQRVAVDLATAQARAGHQVHLIAGSDTAEESTDESHGFAHTYFETRQLYSRLGYAGLLPRHMRPWLRQNHASFDVAHIHLARDLTTLPAADALRRLGMPYVLQTHGMLDRPSNAIAALLDRLVVRNVLRDSKVVIALTEEEAKDLRNLSTTSHVEVVPNGLPLTTPADLPRTRVTFLARLHPRKGAHVFAQAAAELAPRFPQIEFVIAGPDEGGLALVNHLLAGSSPKNLSIVGAVPTAKVSELLAGSLLFVSPAEREPFGMTVLEALAESTPVILHKTAALAEKIVSARAGFSFENGADDLTDVIENALGSSTELAAMGRRGRSLVQDNYSIEHVSRSVMALYP